MNKDFFMDEQNAEMDKAIITVVGKDRVGIIAVICTYLSKENINILDISQTILKGYFNMIMITNISKVDKNFELLSDNLSKLGDELGVSIKIQREAIFNKMHRI